MNHAKPESPLERADRLIDELSAPEWFGNYPRHHATDNRWQERLELMYELHSVPIRYVMGVSADGFVYGSHEAGRALKKYEMELRA